jgi:4-amino-4-deoxy-L-arabinose transferase-like glycosyltransferase
MNPLKHNVPGSWIVLGLTVAALSMRLPFMTHYLYHWDSVNFALSLERYDVRLQQPHPPGYVLYSALGSIVNAVVHEANTSLVLLSVIGGVAGVIAMYWIGRHMFNRRIGLIAAFLTIASPIQWFHSEVALSYTLEFALVTVVAGLCYRQLVGHSRCWLLTAIAIGLAGGVRQNDLVLLFPLWLVSVWTLTWKHRILSLIALATVCLAWMTPMVALSGGLNGYVLAFHNVSDTVFAESSFFDVQQILVNATRLAIYLGYGIMFGGIVLALAAVAFMRDILTWPRDKHTWLFVLWIVPSLLFYVFIHLRQPGHVFTFLPGVILLVAVAIDALGTKLFNAEQRAIALMTGVILAVDVVFFMLAPASLFGSETLPMQTMSRRKLAQRDQILGERLSYVRAHFDPAATVVYAANPDQRHMDFYLRDYQSPSISYELCNTTWILPPEVKTLLLFNEHALPDLKADVPLQQARLPSGALIRYYTWSTGSNALLNQKRLHTGAHASR